MRHTWNPCLLRSAARLLAIAAMTPAAGAAEPQATIDRHQAVLSLAQQTGSRLHGDMRWLMGLPPVPSSRGRSGHADADFAALLDAHVQHARRCDARRCEVWIVGRVDAAGAGKRTPPGPSPQPAGPVEAGFAAARPREAAGPSAAMPPTPDPPGLFPAD